MSEGLAPVGIVVPTLGTRPEWLECAVGSLERQQHVDVTVVVVTPPEAASRVQAQFPSLRVVAEAGRGIVAAVNTGWEVLANCGVIGWLGDDDELVDGALHAGLCRLQASPGAAMVYGDFDYIDAHGRMLVTVRPGRLAPLLLGWGQNFIGQPGSLYRREAIVRAGGLSPEFRLAFDADLHHRLSTQGAVYCSQVLARVRTHPASLTTAENVASLAELERIVWARRGAIARRSRPLWDAVGRLYYRFHRTKH